MAQDDELSQMAEIAKAALRQYDFPDPVTVKLVNLSENATYKVDDSASGRRWALRVHRPGYHSQNAIASEIAWQVELRRNHVVATPIPVKGTNGDFIQVIGHDGVVEPRRVVLYEWEDGREPDVSKDLSASFEMLGAVAAKMHQHTKSWKLPVGFERFTWNFETSLGNSPHWGRWQDGMAVDPPKQRLFGDAVELIRRRLESYGQGPSRFGLIHCDLRLANLLIDGEEVKVIDFDDCGFGWYMYDAATPVSFYEHRPEVPELIQSWLKGYRTLSEISAADEDEIPTFIMLRRLLLVAWIGSHHYTDLAKSMGAGYTNDTVNLCESYLANFR